MQRERFSLGCSVFTLHKSYLCNIAAEARTTIIPYFDTAESTTPQRLALRRVLRFMPVAMGATGCVRLLLWFVAWRRRVVGIHMRRFYTRPPTPRFKFVSFFETGTKFLVIKAWVDFFETCNVTFKGKKQGSTPHRHTRLRPAAGDGLIRCYYISARFKSGE